MNLVVASFLKASLLLEREPMRWYALVILDSGAEATDFVQTHTCGHLFVRFDDIETPRANKCPPTTAQIKQALGFAQGKERLVVCCRAGQGRSVSLAYLINSRDRGAAEAIEILDATRHRPNRLVVFTGASLLEAPDVVTRFDLWCRETSHIQLSDCYEEMQREFDQLIAQGASNQISRVYP